MASDIDQKIQDVYKRIQTERKVLEASQLLRHATTNPDVLRRNDAKIREAERQLSYFEETLRELQDKKMTLSQGPSGGNSQGDRSPASPSSDSNQYPGGRPPGSPENLRMGLSQKRVYSNLDLIKVDTPVTTARISRMLHQLEFKLQVETQYKKGIDKMAKLYQAEGDKKSRADAEAKRVESDKKIQLLQTSLKRYKNLFIMESEAEEPEPVPGDKGTENVRSKSLTGTLHISLKGANELDHPPLVSRSRSAAKAGIDTFVIIKVDGTQRARSHNSKTDRWNEDFDIPVDKATEIEIAFYDKQASEVHPIPIGLLWIRISDLIDALRRQRVVGGGQGGWVTANAMGNDSLSPHGADPFSAGGMDAPLSFPDGGAGMQPPAPGQPPQEGVEAYFSVEPVGAVSLGLNFTKENVRKRPLEAVGGLGRQGAFRKRKEEIHEMNGHKFIQKQFYQLILCAFCNEFLLNALGYQCEDCRYTCHKKCHEKVVTKCISKSNTGDGDEEKINHRIPHRFEPLTNLGANWCCHCGYMLPLGRKNARKCSECDITCHAHCAHLVPDFCGMSMETANKLLDDWRQINRSRQDRTPKQQHGKTSSLTHVTSPQQPTPTADTLNQGMERMRIQEPPVQQPELPPRQQSPSQDRYTHQQPQTQQQPLPGTHPVPHGQQPSQRPPGTRVPVPPAFPLEQQQAMLQHPMPGDDRYGGYDKPPPLPQKQYPPGPGLPQQQRLPQPTHVPPPQQQYQQPPPQQYQPPPQQQQIVPQKQYRQSQSIRKRKVGLDDFNFLAVLGKGNFGKVMLAEEKQTNDLYAIKVLKKEFIIDNDEVESTRSEKRVFLTAAKERHPFLLGLHSCFQTETRVYFVMEYVSGGDLMLHIQRKQFSLRQAKYYAAEVLLALEYFHANGIIYRDLKLDNILLTLDGHVKVADYGLCKEDMWHGSTTSTFCGTPEFMAPEILLEQRYGRAVDWWAFGVLMYEMLLGQSPFRGDDEDEIFDAILEDEPLYPITMPRDAVSILQKLLTRDPNRRLGSGKGDAEEIKRQPFFKDVNWDDVFNKRIPPPYFPTINGSADTSNFDEEFTREQPTLTPVHGQLSTQHQAMFNGFSWVANWADFQQ